VGFSGGVGLGFEVGLEGEMGYFRRMLKERFLGVITYALNTHGELSLAQLKKQVEGKGPIFEWAIGWLAREDKIAYQMAPAI
jgi:Winged helix-turn-helix domain (DUF2582)